MLEGINRKENRVCLRSRDVELILFLAEYGIIINENVNYFAL